MTEEVLDKKKYIKMIGYESLRNIVEAEIDIMDSDGSKLDEAHKIADVLAGILQKKKLMSPHCSSSFVDVLLSACFLRDLYGDGSWRGVFMAREKLSPMMAQMKITKEISDAVFQTIEAQLGEDMPVPNCRPVPNSPTQDFATAVWFVTEYQKERTDDEA